LPALPEPSLKFPEFQKPVLAFSAFAKPMLLSPELKKYRGRRLFDLAAIESTKPDATRVSGRCENQEYVALYDGYVSDVGHLNAVGSKIAATAFLGAIAQVSRKQIPLVRSH